MDDIVQESWFLSPLSPFILAWTQNLAEASWVLRLQVCTTAYGKISHVTSSKVSASGKVHLINYWIILHNST